ncbi:MAG: type II CRISPR-associated endonuclease Cas1 [Chitinophagaceae bacterium]
MRATIKAISKIITQYTLAGKKIRTFSSMAAAARATGVHAGNIGECKLLLTYSREVKSGDSENHEAKAAAYHWKRIFPDFLEFRRERYGRPPNNLLNYGYAILRAMVARSLTPSGLLPTLGIHHRNQYNAYCLADDIMEPYRAFVDKVVCQIIRGHGKFWEMTPNLKKSLLEISSMDVIVDDQKSPMMIAVQRPTASLAKCFEGTSRKILYPELA